MKTTKPFSLSKADAQVLQRSVFKSASQLKALKKRHARDPVMISVINTLVDNCHMYGMALEEVITAGPRHTGTDVTTSLVESIHAHVSSVKSAYDGLILKS